MYFSYLSQDYAHQLQHPEDRVETKQRIRLSSAAYSILLRDATLLGKVEEQNQLSKIVNHIFSCMVDSARSSIQRTLGRKQQAMLDILGDTPENRQICAQLLKPELAKLREEATARMKKKGSSYEIRLHQESLSQLASQECQPEGPFYKDKIGSYLNALLEEYAEHPYIRRERIYCKKILTAFQMALLHQHILKFTLRSRSRETGLPNLEYFKPYGIYQDPEFLYNYLVGLHSSTNSAPWEITSIRLSSVLDCQELQASAVITKTMQSQIEKRISEKGVQFLADQKEPQTISVRLSPFGQKMYRTMLHLRPVCTQQDPQDPSIYHFTCPLRQIQNYFFKFGRDAEILEPAELRKDFMDRYAQAYHLYADSEV